MVRDFEGRTEKEAIDKAIAELGLEQDEFDVEVLDTEKSGFLNLQKKVRIRVHLPQESSNGGGRTAAARPTDTVRSTPGDVPETDFEHAVVDFVTNLTEKMGFPATVEIAYREPEKLVLRLDSQHSGILIGKKGRNLDALQLLANVVSSRLDGYETKVVLDTENYRARREESLIRMAQQVGDQVKRTRRSRLLEPMNPFERRLIHTTLNDVSDIETQSEGEGLYKQVRISYRGSQN
ncbi:MAG: RNA-binding cell elongation regulator Jag/EloR [Spirochaetaceae bacterium]